MLQVGCQTNFDRPASMDRQTLLKLKTDRSWSYGAACWNMRLLQGFQFKMGLTCIKEKGSAYHFVFLKLDSRVTMHRSSYVNIPCTV